VVPDTIDERAINKKHPLNVYQKTENLVGFLAYPLCLCSEVFA